MAGMMDGTTQDFPVGRRGESGSFSSSSPTEATAVFSQLTAALRAWCVGLRVQEPGKRKSIDLRLYSSPVVLYAPRLSLPGHIGAAEGAELEVNWQR
jgi:hypothetical protein